MQATLSGVPVLRPANLETTALGAARLAMIGVGDAASPGDLPELAGTPTRFEPGAGVADRDGLLRIWGEAVERCKGWAAVGRSLPKDAG